MAVWTKKQSGNQTYFLKGLIRLLLFENSKRQGADTDTLADWLDFFGVDTGGAEWTRYALPVSRLCRIMYARVGGSCQCGGVHVPAAPIRQANK